MKYTTNGIPYPEADDMQGDYPLVAQQVAEELDAVKSQLGGLGIQMGREAISASGNSSYKEILFPKPFTGAPRVTVTVEHATTPCAIMIYNVTTHAFRARWRTGDGSTFGSGFLQWIAVGETE